MICLSLNGYEEMPVDIPTFGEVKNEALTRQAAREMIKDESLARDQVADLENLIEEFKDLFTDRPGKTHITTHDIELTSDEPVQVKPYRVSPRQVDLMRTEVERMLKFGVIEAGDSDYASPMIMVEAPGKEPRPCIDYRRLNAKTRDHLYPIPNIEG